MRGNGENYIINIVDFYLPTFSHRSHLSNTRKNLLTINFLNSIFAFSCCVRVCMYECPKKIEIVESDELLPYYSSYLSRP